MAKLAWRMPIGMIVDTTIASEFGAKIAEAPILNKMRNDPSLGKPQDYGLYADKGTDDSDKEMFVFIALRNDLPKERITEMIAYRKSRGKGQWSRPDALCHTKAACEYYEIKPEGASSMRDGLDKLPNIAAFMKTFGLEKRYRAGVIYLSRDGDTDEAQLLDSDTSFQIEMQALQTMFGVGKIQLFIQWEKPTAGLIVYRAKVTVDTDDSIKDTFPMREFAVCVVTLAIEVALGKQLGASATRALPNAVSAIRLQLDGLKRNLDNSMRLHQTLLAQATPSTAQKVITGVGLLNPITVIPTLVNIATNPAMKQVLGAAVQTLNPASHTLAIWKPVQDAMAASAAALQARNVVKAFSQLAIAQASFVKATHQLTAFQNGTELAGSRAQVIIGVAAAVTTLAALAVFSVGAATAAVGQGSTAVAVAGPVKTRIAVEAIKEAMVRVATAETAEAVNLGVEAVADEAPKFGLRMVMSQSP